MPRIVVAFNVRPRSFPFVSLANAWQFTGHDRQKPFPQRLSFDRGCMQSSLPPHSPNHFLSPSADAPHRGGFLYVKPLHRICHVHLLSVYVV